MPCKFCKNTFPPKIVSRLAIYYLMKEQKHYKEELGKKDVFYYTLVNGSGKYFDLVFVYFFNYYFFLNKVFAFLAKQITFLHKTSVDI